MDINNNSEYRFFWMSNVDPFNKEKSIWSPYSQTDSDYLERCFQVYLRGEGVQPKLGDYIFNFDIMMQIHSIDNSRQRPISREKLVDEKKLGLQNRFNNVLKCLVCKNSPMSVIFAPCGHFCCCDADGKKLINEGVGCPVCRQKIDSLIKKVYFSSD